MISQQTESEMPAALAWQESPQEPNRYRITGAEQTKWIATLLLNGEALVETQRATMNRIVNAYNNHEALLIALQNLQASPNDPRAHRVALDAIKKVTQAAGGAVAVDVPAKLPAKAIKLAKSFADATCLDGESLEQGDWN